MAFCLTTNPEFTKKNIPAPMANVMEPVFPMHFITHSIRKRQYNYNNIFLFKYFSNTDL